MSLRSSVERPDHGFCAGDPPGTPGRAVRSSVGRSLVWLLSLPIWLYRYGVSPFVVPRCRFMPSCSEYALGALARHGPMGGTWLTLRRLVRCHPWGGFGYDPVPPRADPNERNDQGNQKIGSARDPDGGKASVGFASPQPRISASR